MNMFCNDFSHQLLENALRKYPSSTPERWEKIAAEVPGRTKKECMRRYKVGLVSALSLHICMNLNVGDRRGRLNVGV